MVSFGSDNTNSQELVSKVDLHSKSLVSVIERQKDLEGKVDLVDEKIELLDHNSIRELKRLSSDIKHLRDEIHDLKSDLDQIKEFQSKVKNQFRVMSTKDEVQKLERYIDLWNPMQFATREELKDLRDEIINHLTDDISRFLYGKSEEDTKKSSKKQSKKET